MRRSLWPWLACSLVTALLGFALACIGTAVLWPSLGLSALWVLIFVASLIRLRWRGLWLLVGAPLALAWPTVIVGFSIAIDDCVAKNPGAQFTCLP
jgi:hypothetical protein